MILKDKKILQEINLLKKEINNNYIKNNVQINKINTQINKINTQINKINTQINKININLQNIAQINKGQSNEIQVIKKQSKQLEQKCLDIKTQLITKINSNQQLNGKQINDIEQKINDNQKQLEQKCLDIETQLITKINSNQQLNDKQINNIEQKINDNQKYFIKRLQENNEQINLLRNEIKQLKEKKNIFNIIKNGKQIILNLNQIIPKIISGIFLIKNNQENEYKQKITINKQNINQEQLNNIKQVLSNKNIYFVIVYKQKKDDIWLLYNNKIYETYQEAEYNLPQNLDKQWLENNQISIKKIHLI